VGGMDSRKVWKGMRGNVSNAFLLNSLELSLPLQPQKAIRVDLPKEQGADGVVCASGQDSGRLVKIWYDSSWGQKRR
jgi:hypothetical protein